MMNMLSKNFKNTVLFGLLSAVMLFALTACNTVPEDNIGTSTPAAVTPSATIQTTAEPTQNTTAVPGETGTPQLSGTAENSATPDASAAVGTETPAPSATVAPSAGQPSASATVKPSATQNATATTKPSATVKPSATTKPTSAVKPSATTKPTATQSKEVYQTITYEGKTYKVLMGRNGNPNLIKDYSTLPPILQAYAYPTFDPDVVIRDIYQYAKTKGFTAFGYAQDVMTEELAERCSWDSPSFYSYPGDSYYTEDYTEVDDAIAAREFYKSDINFLANELQQTDRMEICLTLWIYNCYDSSYRENDSYADGFYDGQYTREYAMYFMYGWPLEVPEYIF